MIKTLKGFEYIESEVQKQYAIIDENVKIMDEINNSGFFKFAWDLFVAKKYKKTRTNTKNAPKRTETLLSLLY